jgi:hypothetical protein
MSHSSPGGKGAVELGWRQPSKDSLGGEAFPGWAFRDFSTLDSSKRDEGWFLL